MSILGGHNFVEHIKEQLRVGVTRKPGEFQQEA